MQRLSQRARRTGIRRKGAKMRARFLVVCFAFLNATAFGLSISSENSATPLPKVTYVKFEDSLEHAFTAEVPEGWEAKGGVYRLGFSDARAMLDLKSPD
jgi:hypothetical protein